MPRRKPSEAEQLQQAVEETAAVIRAAGDPAEIDRLRKALLRIQDAEPDRNFGGDHRYESALDQVQRIARRALEGD